MLIEWFASAPVAEAAILAFAFAFGAGIGSFLNVVAYRLPRGESLVFGGSHCPSCSAAIRSRDNLPVVGWLLLRGRCRDCRERISPRYPAVEAATGLLVTGVVAIDLLGRTATGRPGVDALLFGESWPAVLACGVHCWLVVTMVAWALLAWDGHPLPRRWLCMSVALAAGLGWAWPAIGWMPAIATAAASLLLGAFGRCVRRP